MASNKKPTNHASAPSNSKTSSSNTAIVPAAEKPLATVPSKTLATVQNKTLTVAGTKPRIPETADDSA